MALVSYIQASAVILIIVISITGWMGMARMIRSESFAIGNKPFIKILKVANVSTFKIIFKYFTPLLAPIFLISFTFGVGGSILAESGLSFLGLGINPHNPHPEWAKEIQKGKEGTRLLRQNIKRGLREVVIHKSPTSVFYEIPESEPSITLAEANPQTIIAVQTGESISIGEKVPFTAGVILNQEAFSERDEKGKLVSDSHTWEIRRMGEQQLPNGKWVATYQAFPVLRAVTEEQVETVRWALAANAVKKDYSYTKGTKWAEMSKEQADVIRNETLKHTGLDIYIAKDLLTFVESFLQLRGRPAEMDGKVSYYQNRFLKVGIELDNNNVEFAQHSKSALLNSRSFKTAVHIVNGVVTPLNLNYSDYLKSTLKTNVKSFNIGTFSEYSSITLRLFSHSKRNFEPKITVANIIGIKNQ